MCEESLTDELRDLLDGAGAVDVPLDDVPTEAVVALTPLRRWATAGDVADVVAFLASDAARFVTGETISADGGMANTLDLYAGPV